MMDNFSPSFRSIAADDGDDRALDDFGPLRELRNGKDETLAFITVPCLFVDLRKNTQSKIAASYSDLK